MQYNSKATANFNEYAYPELLRVVLENSLGQPFSSLSNLGLLDFRGQQCTRIRSQLNQLKEINSEDSLKFVFAHLLVPHPPFVFGSQGECLSLETVLKKPRTESYIEQVRFINREILAFIRNLLSSSQKCPIIIIQSDEGPWPERLAGDEVSRLGADVNAVNWADFSNSELKEKMAILNALLLPSREKLDLDSGISPVNTFRIVLREYFDVSIPLLEDKSFVFRDDQHIYEFIDVDERLQ